MGPTIRSAAIRAPARFRADGPNSNSAKAPVTYKRQDDDHCKCASTKGYPQSGDTGRWGAFWTTRGANNVSQPGAGRLPKPVAKRTWSTIIVWVVVDVLIIVLLVGESVLLVLLIMSMRICSWSSILCTACMSPTCHSIRLASMASRKPWRLKDGGTVPGLRACWITFRRAA